MGMVIASVRQGRCTSTKGMSGQLMAGAGPGGRRLEYVCGWRPRATRRSSSRPSATCPGPGRSTASMACGTAAGGVDAGHAGDPRAGGPARPCCRGRVFMRRELGGMGLPPRPGAGCLRLNPSQAEEALRRSPPRFPSVRARGRPGSRPDPRTSARARPSTGWRAVSDRRPGAPPPSAPWPRHRDSQQRLRMRCRRAVATADDQLQVGGVRVQPASNPPATKPHIATASTVSLCCKLCAEQH